jgi:putative transposase
VSHTVFVAVLSRYSKNSKCKTQKEAKKKAKKEHKISQRIHQLALNLMSEHLKFPSAPNSLYNTRNINACLLQISIKEGNAQGELANLQLKLNMPRWVPTGHTFRNRVEAQSRDHVQAAFRWANDEIIKILKGKGVFKRHTTVAIDYTHDPFYGDINAPRVIGGKQDRGTCWGYHYASIHVVEAGRRLTLYTMPVDQFTEKADAVTTLLEKAKESGVHVKLVLLDRGFFSGQVINLLNKLHVHFVMLAVHHNSTAACVVRFTLGEDEKSARFNLAIYPVSKERLKNRNRKKKALSLHDLYFAFATNLPKSVAESVSYIPQEYRRRWGIETGYRVMGMVKAKTTSKNYVLRLTYRLAAVFMYNVWQYGNFLLCRAFKQPFLKRVVALKRLAAHFEGFIIGGLGPPRGWAFLDAFEGPIG